MRLVVDCGAGGYCWLLQHLQHVMVSSRLPTRVRPHSHVTTKPAAASNSNSNSNRHTIKLSVVYSSLQEAQLTMISRHEV